MSLKRKFVSLVKVSIGGICAYGAISFIKNDETFYKQIVMPLVHQIDPENAHKLAIFVHKYRLLPKANYTDPKALEVQVFGKTFTNPIGIAAGFDKDGEAILGLSDIGFGFIEIGSVTPKPQPGNEKPRVFRLSEDFAVINRYGFNSTGHDEVFQRMTRLCNVKSVVGVNLGKNKVSEKPIDDYIQGIQKFGPVADYLVINVSSPNTPGLRDLQNKENLQELLRAAVKARDQLPEGKRPPLLLKLAPDLAYLQRKEIAELIQTKPFRVDAVIISNTTIQRPQFLINNSKDEVGGLSGKPLKDAATEMITQMYSLTNGTIPIIGAGGVFTGQDAYDKIKAGASLVQLYSGLVYEGPPIVTKIKKELIELLKKDGFQNVSEAIGKNNKMAFFAK